MGRDRQGKRERGDGGEKGRERGEAGHVVMRHVSTITASLLLWNEVGFINICSLWWRHCTKNGLSKKTLSSPLLSQSVVSLQRLHRNKATAPESLVMVAMATILVGLNRPFRSGYLAHVSTYWASALSVSLSLHLSHHLPLSSYLSSHLSFSLSFSPVYRSLPIYFSLPTSSCELTDFLENSKLFDDNTDWSPSVCLFLCLPLSFSLLF